MALLTLIVPIGMLGLVLALGRYEELLLPAAEKAEPPEHPAPR
jgi:hypothetical protein